MGIIQIIKVFRFFASITLIIVLVNTSVAQQMNPIKLAEIASNQKQISVLSDQDVEDFMTSNGMDSRIKDLGNGDFAYLRKVLNGIPYFYKSFNEQARKTTGVERIQNSSAFGEELLGQGITIGVWDGGRVLKDHVELSESVENNNFSSISNHATHVTGTIVAKGVNDKAKGMAPMAHVKAFYAFGDDLEQMADEAAEGLILSNHSYGLIIGWQYNSSSGQWEWYGGAEERDLRFGHYNQDSRTIDEIIYNAPYYTTVWSAGNHRNDRGDGTKPPDGPYDIIGPYALAKNVIAVGAITGFDIYEDPTSAVMSEFSSWGPTKDGRIKPDLVADGVGVLSTSSSGTDQYATLQGTSMSAPNVTGSLAILQQYYMQQEDTFMKASELKSLAIHTAKEAGRYPGPDVQFGWGVMDAYGALEVLRSRNSKDTILVSHNILSGEIFEFEIFSDGETPLKATIAWTDLPGNVGSVGNTNPVLVNDLDLRILDEAGTEFHPWAIDVLSPIKAIKSDNDRDNVEQVILSAPESRKYIVRVTHKGILPLEGQEFSLTLTGGQLVEPEGETFYWINGDGDFSSSDQWSLQSGGSSVSSLDFNNSRLIFDENSSFVDGDTIFLSGNVTVKDVIWLSDKSVFIDLQGNTIAIGGALSVDEDSLSIGNGQIQYTSSDYDKLNLGFIGSEGLNFIIDSQSLIELTSDIELANLFVHNGAIRIVGKNIKLDSLYASTASELTFLNNSIQVGAGIRLESGKISSINNDYLLYNSSLNIDDSLVFNDHFQLLGVVELQGEFTIEKLTLDQFSEVRSEKLNVDSLEMLQNTILEIDPNGYFTIKQSIAIESDEQSLVRISSADEQSIANFNIDFRNQLCFDFLHIEDIKVNTKALFNAGLNSEILRSENILELECENLIYPNYESSSVNCANSVIELFNTSVGEIDAYSWEVSSGSILSENDAENLTFYVANAGSTEVKLTVSNSSQSQSFIEAYNFIANQMPEVSIIENSRGLVADQAADSYLWFKNGKLVEGESSRELITSSSGLYQVAYFLNDSTCKNRISIPFQTIITEIDETNLPPNPSLSIYPNPTDGLVTISGLEGQAEILVFNQTGVLQKQVLSNGTEESLSINEFPKGVYLIKIFYQDRVLTERLVKL